jgi:hypothetical protein
MKQSVFEMVHQVLGDAKEKQASSRGVEKRAAAPQPSPKPAGGLTDEYFGKLASACDHLATNLHLIDHTRTPQEKLAEYAAISQALQKRAFEGGDKVHQTTEAESESIPPTSVTTDDSGTGVGSGNAIPSMPATTPGTSMDAGESGEASGQNQPPKTVTPNEKPNANDPPNALETNQGMMMPSQPDDLLNQPGGDEASGKVASARVRRILDKVAGRDVQQFQTKAAAAKRARVLMMKAAQSGIPLDTAASLIMKFAGDEEDPAQISAGTDPLLQSEPGQPSVLSQGAEAGSNTPRGSAPTSGEGAGRDLLSSNESAINATKREAKQQNKGALSDLLTEPMHSSEHDHTLQESLDNTSSAGVKISAARELLKKVALASPEFRQRVAMLVKRAAESEDPTGKGEDKAPTTPPAAEPVAEAPPAEVAAEPAPETGMEAALAAVLAGVTPEDLAAAEALLASGDAGGEAAMPPEGAIPQAGVEDQEKLQQFGMGAGAPTAASSAPTPMMA